MEDLACQQCGFTDHINAYDDLGACDGCVFCPQCHCEIDSSSGELAEPCGKCEACVEIAPLMSQEHPRLF